MLTKQAELAAIDAVQSAIDREGLLWTAGETSVSGLSPEEKFQMGSARVGPPIAGVPIESRPLHLQGVADPAAFDWRDVDGVNWVSPVKSQWCKDCWAFSTSGAIEAAFNIYSGNPDLDINLSEQHIVSACCSMRAQCQDGTTLTYDCGDCGGGWPDYALRFCKDCGGIVDRTCFPYTGRDSACTPCDEWWPDKAYIITGYKYITSKTEDFKWALQEYGPMSVVITVPNDWYFYTAGVYSPSSEGVGWANHAVLLVGWDDARGAWIIKNSYGAGWGGTGKGYALVDYGVLEGYNYAYAVTGIIHKDAPLSCDGGSPTFGTGCNLLLHYDSDGDGVISIDEMGAAVDDFDTGRITEDERKFVVYSYYDGSINTTCPECYSADVITCTGPTEHFSSGCDLLLAYDTDNVPGVITWPELMDAFDDGDDGIINTNEAVFVESAYDAGSINNLCPWCYGEAENIAPTAIASATPTFGTPPLSVQFAGQGTDLDGTIQSYNWNFGDGDMSNIQNPQHTYSNIGAYSPVLTVTDNDGAIGTDNLSILVTGDEVGKWIKPISAKSSSNFIYKGFEYIADFAIDSKVAEGEPCWFSDHEVPCWISFDIGGIETVDAICVVMGKDSTPTTFNIETSIDGELWTTVLSSIVVSAEYEPVEIMLPPLSWRYIKLYITDVNPSYDYGGCCEFDVHVVDDTVANIEVVSFTATPQTCQSPCDVAVSITWKNTGTASATFTPGYTVDGTLYSSSSITLIPGQQGLLRETVGGLTPGSYEICPVPN